MKQGIPVATVAMVIRARGNLRVAGDLRSFQDTFNEPMAGRSPVAFEFRSGIG